MARPRKGKQSLDKIHQVRLSQKDWTRIQDVVADWTKADDRGVSFTPTDVIRHYIRKGLEGSGKK